jgi:hypothetical protein
MQSLRRARIALIGLLLSAAAVRAGGAAFQAAGPGSTDERAVVYDGRFPVAYADSGYKGAAIAVDRDWSADLDSTRFPFGIRSIRVPAGQQLTVYSEPNFRGRSQTLTGNWSPSSAFDPWYGTIRSIQVRTVGGAPPALAYPLAYGGMGFRGPSLALDRDWAGNADWDGTPYGIRSIRVPTGWHLVLYMEPDFQGETQTVTGDWAPSVFDPWYGNVRSIRVSR